MKNFDNIKIISCDLDGTLLGPNGEPSDLTKEVINKLHEKKYILIANTGRPLYSIPNEVVNLPFDYLVGMNGQIILDTKANKIYEKEKLNKSDLINLSDLGNKNMAIGHLHYENVIYLIMSKRNFIFGYIFNQLNKLRFIFKQIERTKVKYVTDIRSLKLNDIAKICFASLGKNLIKLQEEINLLENKPYQTFLVTENWLEVMAADISKGNALIEIAKKENIDIKNTLAIGDGENDIPMLKVAGISVAMENAMDNTKKVADYIAPSFREDGLAKFFTKHLL